MDVEDILRAVPGGTYAVLVAFVVGVTGVVALFCVIGKGGGSSLEGKGARKRLVSEDEQSEAEETGNKNKQPRHKTSKSKPQSSKKVTLNSHPLLAGEFKGHTGAVLSLDFEANGKYLASCSDDRTIRLWYMKTLLDKDHKYARKNIQLDHATHVKFSPDGTAVLATMATTNTVHVYRIKALKGAIASLSDSVVEFPKLSLSTIISFGIASTGKFIMTYNVDSFSVWTLKGEELGTVTTLQSPNTHAAVSPCGRFIACTGFTSDVKIWEVEFTRSGDYQKILKVMDLKGHNASVLSVSFSGDSHRMASASKDGTWKYWDINVEYRLDEDPKLLATGTIPSRGETCVSLAPDSRVVAVSVDFSIYIYSTTSGDLLETLDEVHKGVISNLCWDPFSLYLASAGGEDRHVRVWNNVPGMELLLTDLESRLPKAASEPIKRRITEQIQTTREKLKLLGNSGAV